MQPQLPRVAWNFHCSLGLRAIYLDLRPSLYELASSVIGPLARLLLCPPRAYCALKGGEIRALMADFLEMYAKLADLGIAVLVIEEDWRWGREMEEKG